MRGFGFDLASALMLLYESFFFQHGSIVEEIEAVLRQEILAASTLDERPPSPSSYAKQRTMVVMETVKAATLATARKLEKLAEEQRKKGFFYG